MDKDDNFLKRMLKHLDDDLQKYVSDSDTLQKISTPYTENQVKTEHKIQTDDKDCNVNLKDVEKIRPDRPTLKIKTFSDVVIEEGKNTYTIVDTQVGDMSTIGSIFVTCVNNDCNFIVKVIDIISKAPKMLGNNFFYNYNQVLTEINLQKLASKKNLAPKIIDAFYFFDYLKKDQKYIKISSEINSEFLCRNKSNTNCYVPFRRVYIIMEKMDITVSTFLKNFKDTPLFPIYLEKLKKIAKEKLEKLHTYKIIHNDAHASNFMFNFSEKGREMFSKLLKKEITIDYIRQKDIMKNFFNSFNSLRIIDFGLSNIMPADETQEQQKRDDIEKINSTFTSQGIY
jgi:hypothetical protein